MKNKVSLKEKILKVATELFYVQGIQSTGINQIISESAVAKATFYHYFPSKNDLVSECILAYERYLMHTLFDIFKKCGTPKEYLKEWIAVLKNDFQLKYRGCPIAEAAFHVDSSNKEINNQIHQFIDRLTDLLCEFMNIMKKEGRLSEEIDVIKTSEKIITLYEGAATMWRLTNNIKYVDNLEEMILTLLKI